MNHTYRHTRLYCKRIAKIASLFLFSFFLGHWLGCLTDSKASVPASADGNWGLSFQQEGQPPVGNATSDYLKQFNAHYAADTQEKILYLTFDAGYENGNTAAILDALKKHNAPAAFFLVGNYLNTSPDLVKRMAAEGHIVGNHTFHHPDMSKISTAEAFSKELRSLEELYQQVTGQPIAADFYLAGGVRFLRGRKAVSPDARLHHDRTRRR